MRGENFSPHHAKLRFACSAHRGGWFRYESIKVRRNPARVCWWGLLGEHLGTSSPAFFSRQLTSSRRLKIALGADAPARPPGFSGVYEENKMFEWFTNNFWVVPIGVLVVLIAFGIGTAWGEEDDFPWYHKPGAGPSGGLAFAGAAMFIMVVIVLLLTQAGVMK
jgi:hypothetical protein